MTMDEDSANRYFLNPDTFEEMLHWEDNILYFTTPDEAARFLMWFGRSDNRDQINERVIKGVQKKDNRSYRREVAQAAISYFNLLVTKAVQMVGDDVDTFSTEELLQVLTDVALEVSAGNPIWTNMDPRLKTELRRRADKFLEEYK